MLPNCRSWFTPSKHPRIDQSKVGLPVANREVLSSLVLYDLSLVVLPLFCTRLGFLRSKREGISDKVGKERKQKNKPYQSDHHTYDRLAGED